MTVRSAPLLVAVLGCFAAPTQAQDIPEAPPLPPLDTIELAPPVTIAAEPLPEPADDGGWQGAWQGEWADDGSYRGTWSGTWSEPGPTATRTIGYSAAERAAWLEQCRASRSPAGRATGVAGEPDACESYLQQYEHGYAATAQAPAQVPGAYASPLGAAGAYAPGGYGYPYGPVVWVRVPIVRETVEAEPTLEVGE